MVSRALQQGVTQQTNLKKNLFSTLSGFWTVVLCILKPIEFENCPRKPNEQPSISERIIILV